MVIKTKKDLMDLLERNIREYRLKANESLRKNHHMNDNVMDGREDIPREVIDALLVDFLNYVGNYQGLDTGMYVEHLRRDRDPDES